MKKITVALSLLLSLGACSTDQAMAPVATRALPSKINLDVQSVNLADRSGIQPANSPYNSNHFAPTISESIKQWASEHLQAVGQSGQAIVIIKDASLTEQRVPVKSGVDGWFTRQQGTKYLAHAEVSVEANAPAGFAVTEVTASRSLTLPENPTPVEKQDAYYNLITGLMKDLDQNLQTGIQDHMKKFIITAPIYGVTAVPMTISEDGPSTALVTAPMSSQTASTTSASIPLSGIAGQ